MGHIKSSMDNHVDESCQDCGDDKFVWTYTSQEFPMAQVGSSSWVRFAYILFIDLCLFVTTRIPDLVILRAFIAHTE